MSPLCRSEHSECHVSRLCYSFFFSALARDASSFCALRRDVSRRYHFFFLDAASEDGYVGNASGLGVLSDFFFQVVNNGGLIVERCGERCGISKHVSLCAEMP